VDEQRLAAADDLTAADVLVVGLEGLDQFLERQAVLDEPLGIDTT